MLNNRGILIVVSGFSGAGKGTVMKRLMEKYNEDYALSVSMTTRGPRNGEVDGVHYFFVSREQFEENISKDIDDLFWELQEKYSISEFIEISTCNRS